MTAHKHLKERVRSRMHKTGESYTTARRHVVRHATTEATDPATRWHFPGRVPATTALRVLLAHAGVRAPHTGEPFSEAMLFGLAGGIGIGVCAFFYEKEQVASFFLAGRHRWYDDALYLTSACKRLGIEPTVHETGSAKVAEKQLSDVLAEGPCIAWVDMANLPHRAMPAEYSGCGYHVVTVYRKDEANALVGDLTDEPIPIALPDLARARARIKKQKHRLLSSPESAGLKDLAPLVREGLRACHAGFSGADAPANARSMFTPEAIRQWAERLHGSKDSQRWDRIFAGPRLWRGLLGMYDFIERYGTGGGLCRPIFAEFLTEAADALGDAKLRALGKQYAELGRAWSDLAEAALPDDVPAFREVRKLVARRGELLSRGGPPDDLQAVWERLAQLDRQKADAFPLSESECADLRAALQTRVQALYEAEKAALAALSAAVR